MLGDRNLVAALFEFTMTFFYRGTLTYTEDWVETTLGEVNILISLSEAVVEEIPH